MSNERNYEVELRFMETDLRNAKMESEAYKAKLKKDFKAVKGLIDEFASRDKKLDTSDANIENLQAILRKVSRILDRNDI